MDIQWEKPAQQPQQPFYDISFEIPLKITCTSTMGPLMVSRENVPQFQVHTQKFSDKTVLSSHKPTELCKALW